MVAPGLIEVSKLKVQLIQPLVSLGSQRCACPPTMAIDRCRSGGDGGAGSRKGEDGVEILLGHIFSGI